MWLTRLFRRHHEVAKFLLVGGLCTTITAVVNYSLKLTVLQDKPVTALTIGTLLGTIVSYVLNREWSFSTRGGRERKHEAALFFAVSGVGIVLNSVPLWISRYVFRLEVPHVSLALQEVADFVAGIILGTLIALVFRLWAMKRFVFPEADARPKRPSRGGPRSPVLQHDRSSHTAGPAAVTTARPTDDPAAARD